MTCEHGQLERQCPLCERDAEIAELRAHLESLQNRYAQATSELLEIADRDRLTAENERLRQALRDVIQHQTIIGGSASLHSSTVAIARAALGEE